MKLPFNPIFLWAFSLGWHLRSWYSSLCKSSSLFFSYSIYLFIERQKESMSPSAGSLPQCLQQPEIDWPHSEPGTQSRSPRQASNYLSHHCCPPGSALAGSWNWGWSWTSNPTLSWEMQHLNQPSAHLIQPRGRHSLVSLRSSNPGCSSALWAGPKLGFIKNM